MITLIFSVLLGLGLAYVAIQNTQTVLVTLNQNTWFIPLYIIVLGALLVGLATASIFNLFDWMFSDREIRAKKYEVNEATEIVQKLDKRVHELEAENTQLKEEKEEAIRREHAAHSGSPGFLTKLRHGLSM